MAKKKMTLENLAAIVQEEFLATRKELGEQIKATENKVETLREETGDYFTRLELKIDKVFEISDNHEERISILEKAK